jgi:hypothetical protein
MIVSALLYALGLVIEGLTLVLKNTNDVTVSPSIVAAIAQVNSWAYTLYALVPIEHIFICVGILILWEKGWMIYQGVRWAWNKIPGMN